MTANWKVELSKYWKQIECDTRDSLHLVKEHLKSDGLLLNKNFIDYFMYGATTRILNVCNEVMMEFEFEQQLNGSTNENDQEPGKVTIQLLDVPIIEMNLDAGVNRLIEEPDFSNINGENGITFSNELCQQYEAMLESISSDINGTAFSEEVTEKTPNMTENIIYLNGLMDTTHSVYGNLFAQQIVPYSDENSTASIENVTYNNSILMPEINVIESFCTNIFDSEEENRKKFQMKGQDMRGQETMIDQMVEIMDMTNGEPEPNLNYGEIDNGMHSLAAPQQEISHEEIIISSNLIECGTIGVANAAWNSELNKSIQEIPPIDLPSSGTVTIGQSKNGNSDVQPSRTKCNIASVCAQNLLRTNTNYSRRKRTNNNRIKPKPYECKYCEYKSSSEWGQKRHAHVHTGQQPHQCEKCAKTFSDERSIKTHMRIHANDFAFHCLICLRGFDSEEAKISHERKCKSRRYECYLCKYYTFIKQHCTDHMRSHTGEKPFRCLCCFKSFTQKRSLTTHMKVCKNKNKNIPKNVKRH